MCHDRKVEKQKFPIYNNNNKSYYTNVSLIGSEFCYMLSFINIKEYKLVLISEWYPSKI